MRRFFCLFCFFPLAIANADDSAPFIVVESARANAASTIDPSKATGPVRIIQRSEFENRTVNLSDTLNEETGIQVRQNGGLGGYASVSIRGSTSQQVQVVVDGMLLNDPVTGGANIGQLALNDIARIQVYPGSAPAELAHAGIGGVVVMETLGKDIEDTTRLTLGAGSFDTYKTGLFNSGSHGRFYYWASLNRQSSNNDYPYSNDNAWFNPNDGKNTKRRNADYEQNDFSTKLGWEIDDNSQINALLQYTDRNQGVPTTQNWALNNASLSNEALRGQLHYRKQSWLDGLIDSSHRVIWSNSDEHYDNRTGLVGLGNANVYTTTRQLGMVNTASLLLGDHTVTASVDVTKYDYDQINRSKPRPPDQRERLMISSSLSHQWFSSNRRWRTQASVRQFDIHDSSDRTLANNSTRRTSDEERHQSWQLGLNHFLSSEWSLSGNLSSQVRIPTLQEIYGQQGLFVGNPNLQPEESLNVDLTLRTDQRWGHLETTGFYRDLDPAIAPLYDARGVGRFTNLEAIAYGVELEGLWRIADFWELRANSTLQDSENQSDKVRDRQGKQLPGVYHESYRVSSRWHIRPVSFELSYQYDDELYYDSSNLLAADARKLMSATLTWNRIWPNRNETEIALEIRNLTDEIYQDFSRFPGPGRSLFINLKHSL